MAEGNQVVDQSYKEFEEISSNITAMYLKYDFIKYHVKENYFTSIMKLIYFTRDYLMHKNDSYYNKSVIYDAFRVLDSFRINSITNFHQCYRSLMENILRSILLLSDEDETGVNQLFSNIEEKFSLTPELTEIISYIKGEYGKSCDFIHSNIKSGITKELFFSDFLKNEEISAKRSYKNIESFEMFLKKYVHLIILTDSSTLENVYYRRKPTLYRLVGKEEYHLFLKNANKI